MVQIIWRWILMGLKRIFNDKEVGLVVSHLPNRKKPVLIALLENGARVVGNFRSEEDAEIFDRTLNLLVLGKEGSDSE
jgi:hypothetical protein